MARTELLLIMYDISCPAKPSQGIYDRQLDTALFKRLHGTNFTLKPKPIVKMLGPGSYNPMTIDEIYRQKSCSKYGPYYQQTKSFPSINRKNKHFCHCSEMKYRLSNIPDELQRKREFERRYNSIRLDQQSDDTCRKRKEYLSRVPPVTLYEKTSFVDEILRIYGPYVKLGKDRQMQFPEWYKGPARLQDKVPPSIYESLFSKSNRYKGKFLPMPSSFNRKTSKQNKTQPGPTTYFKNLISQRKPPSKNQEKNSLFGFLSSTERFKNLDTTISDLGPAAYKSHLCPRICSKKKQTNTKV